MHAAHRRYQHAGYLICISAFALMVWSFYPGLMSPDSINNLEQGRQNVFYDINAPLMSYIWGCLDKVVSGPALIFILHSAAFWAACLIFWQSTSRRSLGLGLALVLFSLTPHILAQTAVVWKDVALGAGLFLSVSLLYFAAKSGNKLAFLISPAFLFYGYAARLNALPAVLPIAVWTGFVAVQVFEIPRSSFFTIVLGSSYFLVLSAAVFFVNYKLTDGQTVYPFQQVYLYDLAAISVEKNESLFPGYIQSGNNFSMDKVRLRYNARSVNDLIYADIPEAGDLPVLKITHQPGEEEALRQKWIAAVTENPAAYLTHRFQVFAALMGLRWSVTRAYWDIGFASSPPEFRGSENPGYRTLMKYFGAFKRPFSQTFFFRGFIWLVASIYFFYQAMRHKVRGDWALVCVLSISGLLYTAAYFPTTPSSEFRYLFWPAISSALTIIFGVYLLRMEKMAVCVKVTE